MGGAATHRLDLSQMVMLKDNHVWQAGSITKAVQTAKTAAGFSAKIEVEARDLTEALEARKAGADIVMLDNFRRPSRRPRRGVLKAAFPSVLVEASGGITRQTMAQYLSEDVDVVSQGALTGAGNCVCRLAPEAAEAGGATHSARVPDLAVVVRRDDWLHACKDHA